MRAEQAQNIRQPPAPRVAAFVLPAISILETAHGVDSFSDPLNIILGSGTGKGYAYGRSPFFSFEPLNPQLWVSGFLPSSTDACPCIAACEFITLGVAVYFGQVSGAYVPENTSLPVLQKEDAAILAEKE